MRSKPRTYKYYIFLYNIIAASFLFLFLPSPIQSRACSPSDFVLDDFAKRCLDLTEQIKDTELAQRMAFPDAASRSALLLDSWLSFFLDHGVTPPPIYASMAGPAWEAGMRSIGTHIGDLGRGEATSPESMDLMILPFELLARPEQLLPFQDALASLGSRIEEITAKTASASEMPSPAQLADDPEIGQSFALITSLCENAPALRVRLATLRTSLTASQILMNSETQAGSATVNGTEMQSSEDRLALLELHLGSLRDELAFLSPLAFWQSHPIASPTILGNP